MLSQVGIATCTGQIVKVPIVVRSLAESMASLDEHQLPIVADDDFLMTLDADLSVQDNICQIAEHYDCAWWDKRKPRNLDTAEILDKYTMEKCLETHLKQLFSDDGLPPKMLSTIQCAPASATEDNKCGKCVQYRQILADTLQDLVDTHNYTNAMSTSFNIQWNIDMCRASTFNLLHEAAVVKEMAGSSSASSAVRRPKTTGSVEKNSKTGTRSLTGVTHHIL